MRQAAPLAVAATIVLAAVAAWRWLVGTGTDLPPPPALSVESSAEEGTPFSPDVRVNLTPFPARRVRLAVDGPYEVRPVGSPTVLGRGERLASSDVVATGTGLKVGDASYLAARIEIVPLTPPSVWVGDHQYRGAVRLYRRPGGTVLAVNAVPLEEYVASVVDGEMPSAFPRAAREAQAVVARTYALAQMGRRHPLFDVYASTRSQKYLGFQYRDGGRRLAGESAESRAIARWTRGMVCTYRGKLFCTYYSAVCGGETIEGRSVFSDAAPPHAAVPCAWCEAADLYRWTVKGTRREVSADLRRRFAPHGGEFGTLKSLAERGETFRAGDGRRTYELTAAELREALSSVSLPSPRFAVRLTGETVVFEGRGHGHGVGLCQWGARGLALAGRDRDEILRHYYPGAEVVVIEGAGQE